MDLFTFNEPTNKKPAGQGYDFDFVGGAKKGDDDSDRSD